MRRILPALLAALVGAAASIPLSAAAQAPDVADLVERNAAYLKLDRANPAMGEAFGMHFISTLKVNGEIWAYYMAWEFPHDNTGHRGGGVGLATSTDGVNFVNKGWVLKAGADGAPDDDFASFPGLWYENGTFYMVYEASGGQGFPGAIGLATSSDGKNFTKQGIILQKGVGWESVNVGTPNLLRENGVWYLFYHGYDNVRCQIGLATGTDLMNLTKYAGNPVVSAVPGTWTAGTAGKRDIVKRDGKFYMVFEGSGPKPYETAPWTSGLAASSNLFDWVPYSQNNVLPQIPAGFGNDGPAFVATSDGNYIYYRSGDATARALIADESHGGFDHQWAMNSPQIGHLVGRMEADGGWGVTTNEPANYLQFGPYFTGLSVGEHIATWKLQIDNNSNDNWNIVRLEVVDVDDGGVSIASREITRKQWKQAGTYEYFSVPFRLDAARAGHRIEMRVYWHGIAYVKQKLVGVN